MKFSIQNYIAEAQNSIAYDSVRKDKFLRMSRHILKTIANMLHLEPGTYKIHTNKAGIAVSGSVSLHTEHLYINLEQSFCFDGQAFMYRATRNMKDYRGGNNHWMNWSKLEDLDAVVKSFQIIMQNWESDRYFGPTA